MRTRADLRLHKTFGCGCICQIIMYGPDGRPGGFIDVTQDYVERCALHVFAPNLLINTSGGIQGWKHDDPEDVARKIATSGGEDDSMATLFYVSVDALRRELKLGDAPVLAEPAEQPRLL